MLSETDVARDILTVEKDAPSKRTRIPKELTFDEIVKNNTLPPCSLNEFMDYLVCEESNAELLQFFTWFCRYVERWSELPPRERKLSQTWKHADSAERARTNGFVHAHRRAGSDRLDQILEILVRRSASDETTHAHEVFQEPISASTRNFSTPRRFSDNNTSQLQIARDEHRSKEATAVGNDPEYLAGQPFREEVVQIVEHYIQDGAPRKLKISLNDLRECLDAVKTTTHPSALLPAFTAAETILKSTCHPEFIRKSQRNACAARLTLIQVLGATLFVLGIAADVVFILSGFSRYFRLISLVLYWSGITLLVAAAQGVCVLLYMRNSRQLRPWEQVEYAGAMSRSDTGDGKDIEITQETGRIASRAKGRELSRTSPGRTIDPLRKGSMQVFGEANNWEGEARMKAYGTKPYIHKILDDTVRTQNRAIRLLQDRVVVLSICWAGVASTVLAVGLLFVPSVDLF